MKKIFYPDFALNKDGKTCDNAGVALSPEDPPIIFCALDAKRRGSCLGKYCQAKGLLENVIPTRDPQLSLF